MLMRVHWKTVATAAGSGAGVLLLLLALLACPSLALASAAPLASTAAAPLPPSEICATKYYVGTLRAIITTEITSPVQLWIEVPGGDCSVDLSDCVTWACQPESGDPLECLAWSTGSCLAFTTRVCVGEQPVVKAIGLVSATPCEE